MAKNCSSQKRNPGTKGHSSAPKGQEQWDAAKE